MEKWKRNNEKKSAQLGINASTAKAKLVKDLLFSFVEKASLPCFHCGEQLTRDTFSIEHKVPWLHSKNPTELFFDLDNIAFSHLSCNIRAGRRGFDTK